MSTASSKDSLEHTADSGQPFAQNTQLSAVNSSGIAWRSGAGVAYVIVIFFVSQIIAGVLLYAYAGLQHWSDARTTSWINSSIPAQFTYVVVAEGLVLGAIYAWLRHYRAALSTIGLVRVRLRHLGYGVLAVVPYYVLYVALLAVATHFSPIDVNQQQDVGFNNVYGAGAHVLAFVSLVILPPLTEEIMVRGLLYTSLRKVMRFGGAMLVTSAIFAAAHLPEAASGGPLWVAAVDTFTLSVVLCYLREKTGSLWPGITLHALKNGIAFVALFIIGAH